MNAPFPLCAEAIAPVDLHDPAEVARIEDFVSEADGALPFHRPAWLHAVEHSTGQRATGLVAEKGGAITGWLPLTEVHSPLFGRALVSSGFAVGGGVLATRDITAQRLTSAAEELAVRHSCPTIELRGGDVPAGWDRIEGKHCNFIADLAEDREAQLTAIPRKQRAEVRKGLKHEMEIAIGRGDTDLDAHYAVYAESVRNLGTPVFPRALFAAMIAAFGDEADILTVRHDGVPVASVLSFYHRGTVMPFWGGGSWAARHLRANEVMYYELMCHAIGRGCTRFDFGRSKTGSGPYSFKKNWGFEPEPLVYSSWTAPGEAKRNIDPTDAGYSAKIELWKRLPLPVANLVGPHIAKGLA